MYTELYHHKSQIGSETSSVESYKVHSRYIFRIQRNHRGVRKQEHFYIFNVYIYLFNFIFMKRYCISLSVDFLFYKMSIKVVPNSGL